MKSDPHILRLYYTLFIAVASKRYRFTPRLLQVFDTLADVDFVGLQ